MTSEVCVQVVAKGRVVGWLDPSEYDLGHGGRGNGRMQFAGEVRRLVEAGERLAAQDLTRRGEWTEPTDEALERLGLPRERAPRVKLRLRSDGPAHRPARALTCLGCERPILWGELYGAGNGGAPNFCLGCLRPAAETVEEAHREKGYPSAYPPELPPVVHRAAPFEQTDGSWSYRCSCGARGHNWPTEEQAIRVAREHERRMARRYEAELHGIVE